MRLRSKIVFFMIAFISISAIFGVSTFFILEEVGGTLDEISSELKRDTINNNINSSMVSMLIAVKGWTIEHDDKYQKIYAQNAERLRMQLSEFNASVSDKDYSVRLSEMIGNFLTRSDAIMSVSWVGSDIERLKTIDMLYQIEVEIYAEMEIIREVFMKSVNKTMGLQEKVHSRMTVYLMMLLFFSISTSGVLAILMRRSIMVPYEEMLNATEMISSGRLEYRIPEVEDKDFRAIGDRFNAMVESLDDSQKRLRKNLKETELYLQIARIASMTLERKKALALMCETIADKMEHDVCAVFLLKPEKKAFMLEACNMAEGSETMQRPIPMDHPLCYALIGTLEPIVMRREDGLEKLCPSLRAAIIAPIVQENMCAGMLIIGSFTGDEFSDEEINTARIIVHNISAAVRNFELYEAANKQLIQLKLVFQLNQSLASVQDTDDILQTISKEVAKLINAKGCMIRLIEGDMLRVKSYSGQPSDLKDEIDMPVGKGVAGWVAKEGKSLLVEDIAKLPEDMVAPLMALKTAISVPLKTEEGVIGTLGLYDKLDERGDIIPFSTDDLAIVEGFASISSIAIHKARMRELRVRSEAKVQEARQRMNVLFESVQTGIMTLDRDYTITSANRYVEGMMGRKIEELIGMNSIDLFHNKGGICPHCVAKATFETGGYNSITQSSGLNFAELSSYPIMQEGGTVLEAVVFIQDITERVLYEEEIMGLYSEVTQNKEYIESLIQNSADAIVTYDLSGVVTSWNAAAQETYGFRSEEAIGKFMPFVPDSLVEFEKENIQKIRKGQVMKIETYRQKADGSIIEVSLTMSPIKNTSGEVIGISSISRDISDKKRVEKELIRRNQELSRLFFISSAMRGTLELDKMLRMVLTAVTMSDGLGFNRAMLFFVDEGRKALRGYMGIGPATHDEAWMVWERLSSERTSLRDIMIEIETQPLTRDTSLDRIAMDIEISLDSDTVLSRAVRDRKPINVLDVQAEHHIDMVLIQQLGTEAFAVIPLVYRHDVIGLLWVDNLFNRKPITDDDMKFLVGFADHVASAIESARLFQKVSLAEAELENIFASISEMVYFTSADYTIKNANKSVIERLGLTREQVVGHKCYEVFHGMDHPAPHCPHHKTVQTLKPYIEEIEDAKMGGTFLTSTAPLFDQAGAFMGTVHVVRDVTELKQLRVKLQSAERKAALGDVAAKVAHEIRNPLVSVGGFAKRLESKLDGNLKEYASVITNEVRRLEVILKDILGFVKEVRMSKREVDLNDIVRGSLELLKLEFARKGNVIDAQYAEPPLILVVDPDRIKEAIFNIVDNANIATDGGTITVRTLRDGDSAVLLISDTGPGIKEQIIERIFDPFFTTRNTGTGLGLAISKRIVEEHDGVLSVRSGPDVKGAEFRIKLPLGKGAVAIL